MMAGILMTIFWLYWVGGTIKRLPKDIAHLQYLHAEQKTDLFRYELIVCMFYWVVTVILIIILVIPLLVWSLNGWISMIELLKGFGIA